ncbi:MAG: phosphoribosylamine--glycine ligase [Candidatus Micrarchaeota archaeon]
MAIVMIVGSGAREHVISCAYEKSPHVSKIVVAPGNDFMTFNRQKEVVIEKDCKLTGAESFLRIALKHKPDLIEVAQDDALACGTVDLLQANGFRVFGPTKQAARIEWDKKWSREFMQKNGIPSPEFAYFDNAEQGKKYAAELYEEHPDAIVFVKATGLCAGKGALKATNLREANAAIDKMQEFGEAGRVFLIEEGLVGEEFSCYAIIDGEDYFVFKSAQDNKLVFDGDKGGQTGGMGAISPAMVTNGFEDLIEENLIAPVVAGFKSMGIKYVGMLYLGGIIVDGEPMNIEYNARWGDPECQVVLPPLETDYFELVNACIDGKLSEIDVRQDDKARVCVVGASKGYPGDYSEVKGKRITGLEEAMAVGGVNVYGAGIKKNEAGEFIAAGGRLFSVVGEGRDLPEAKKRAYEAIAKVSVEGNNLHYRADIGWRDLKRLGW